MTDVLSPARPPASRLEQLQVGDERRSLPPEAGRVDGEQGPAADLQDRRIRAHDEKRSPGRATSGRFETDRANAVSPARAPPGRAGAPRAMISLVRRGTRHARALFHGAARPAGARVCRRPCKGTSVAGQADDVAAVTAARSSPLEIDRRALPRPGESDRVAVRLQTRNLGLGPLRIDLDAFVGRGEWCRGVVPVTTVPKIPDP